MNTIEGFSKFSLLSNNRPVACGGYFHYETKSYDPYFNINSISFSTTNRVKFNVEICIQ